MGVAYSVVRLTASGLDFDSGEEQALFARVVAMYAVGRIRQPGRPVRTGKATGVHGAGERAAPGANRAPPGHSRHDRPDRIHDRPGDTPGHEAGRRVERGAYRHAGADILPVECGHVGTEAPHRRAGHIFEGSGSWAACSGRTPRRLRRSGLISGRDTPVRDRSRSLVVETRLPTLLHRAQRGSPTPFRDAEAGRLDARLDFEADGIRLSVSTKISACPTTTLTAGNGFEIWS